MLSCPALLSVWPWEPIPGCPGRFVLRSDTAISVEHLLGPQTATMFDSPHARDRIAVVAFEDGGGLLSYCRADGTQHHTLNTAEGLQRKLRQLGLVLP